MLVWWVDKNLGFMAITDGANGFDGGDDEEASSGPKEFVFK